jgi:outer membrane protein TolC
MTQRHRWIIAWALAVCAPAVAAPPLPPSDALDRAVAVAPAVAEARAAADEAAGTSQILRSGPHEWTVRGTGQIRDMQGAAPVREWDTGLETGWRVGAKRRLDFAAADLEGERATIRVAAAERDARRSLLEAWFSCIKTDNRLRLARAGATDVARLGAVANQRVVSGDGSELERKLAAAERASADTEVANAEAAARAARQWLSMLGLDVPCVSGGETEPPAAAPSRRGVDTAIGLAQRDVARARLDVERARADRIPDPVIGIKFANERGGAERIVGLTFSIPLPGARRAGELARASAHARRVEQGAALAELQHRRLLGELDLTREALVTRRQLAQAEAVAREEAAATMAHAYALGDGDLALVAAAHRDARRARASADDALYDAWLAASVSQLYGLGSAQRAGSDVGS